MHVRVWGCRGSLATPGADTIRYGGNTSCVEVRLGSGDTLVLDAGTGIRPLGAAMDLESVGELHVLLTHLHLDHLQGLGFFRPLFEPDLEVHVWGPASSGLPLADRIAMYLSPPLFPVGLADLQARITFHDAPDEPFRIGSAIVQAAPVTHQGPTVGYRVEENGKVLAYLPDHEPSLGIDLLDQPLSRISGYEVARDADLLFHDAQYGDAQYPSHVGWGHSAYGHAVRFAARAEVDTVAFFHHDPSHTDDRLDELLVDARRACNGAPARVWSAHEGMAIVLDDRGPPRSL
jgi:phosphoribosyl 1,2-cyclic phosphodiesterase